MASWAVAKTNNSTRTRLDDPIRARRLDEEPISLRDVSRLFFQVNIKGPAKLLLDSVAADREGIALNVVEQQFLVFLVVVVAKQTNKQVVTKQIHHSSAV